MRTKKTLRIIGLSSNLIGAILLVFSVKIFDPIKECGAGIQICGNKLLLVMQSQPMLWIGIILLIVGFLLQLISEFFPTES